MTDSTSHSMQHSADLRGPDPNFIKWLKENCVPIVGMAFGALVLCLFAHYTTVDWTRTKDFAEAFASITQSLALIAGGVWAYFKFAKGRTFQERLTPTLTGRLVSIDECVFLVITMQFKNVGLSRIAFDQETSLLAVFEFVPSKTEEILRVNDSLLASFRVFRDKDRYIEPNEVVERQRLFVLPEGPSIGYQLEIEVVTDSGYAWRATTVVDKSAVAHNTVG